MNLTEGLKIGLTLNFWPSFYVLSSFSEGRAMSPVVIVPPAPRDVPFRRDSSDSSIDPNRRNVQLKVENNRKKPDEEKQK